MKNSFKLEDLYNAIYPMIDWHDKDPFDAEINKIERINNLRKKYRKIMETVVGEIPEEYKDTNAYYIHQCHVPVIAALLIRTASDKDKRYKRYRSWLSGKYLNHPEKYYPDILKFGNEIEDLLDDLFNNKIYIVEIQENLKEDYPNLKLELTLQAKNFWELLLKESINYNETRMLCSMLLSLKEFELYLPILPQVFDYGEFE